MSKLLEELSNLVEYYIGSSSRKTTIILGSSITLLLISYWVKKYIERRGFFKRINLPSPKPLPLFGNFLDILRNGLIQNDIKHIKTYGRICGFFEGSTPVIIATDLRFLKTMMIKDFSSFVNRRVIDSFAIDPFDKFLTNLKDDEWKNVRSVLTATFTSGKLKSMSKCMLNCIENYDKYLSELVEKDGILATKSFFGSYTLDIISSCCFGIDTNSINDPDNEFLKNLQTIFSAGFSENPKLIIAFLAPSLANFLVRNNLIEFFPMKQHRFLEEITNAIIERRKAKIDRRDDFIQSIIEHEEEEETTPDKSDARENRTWNKPLKKTLTNKEILAQAILFLAAGYETSSTTLEFISYNLATHEHVQETLIDEVDRVLQKHNGDVSYETIMDMKYMDMVIDETLRLYPPATRLERVASRDYKYDGEIEIQKGQIIVVPIYALHHDPEIYPDPEQFNPERFSEENRKSRENVAFIPFGSGPRNCIGMRFAIIEIKLLLTKILSQYRFLPCEKTPEISMDTLDSFGTLKSKKPIFLKVESRHL